jgi:hypothetical protein
MMGMMGAMMGFMIVGALLFIVVLAVAIWLLVNFLNRRQTPPMPYTPNPYQQNTHEEFEDHPSPGILSENLFVDLPRQRLLVSERGRARECIGYSYENEQQSDGSERVPPFTLDQRRTLHEARAQRERDAGEHHTSCGGEKEPNKTPALH